jgi:triosephosphate isomerase
MKPLIVGNWKMNTDMLASRDIAAGLAREVINNKFDKAEVVVCPPFPFLSLVGGRLVEANIKLGAQDCHQHNQGAHTGDVSAKMLKDVGCTYVILGHSERRVNHKETSQVIQQKARAAHAEGLTTIICVGENEKEREGGKTLEFVKEQMKSSLPPSSNASNTVIAYEPVWAIGMDRTPSVRQVCEVHDDLRSALGDLMDNGQLVRLLYGGSVKHENVSIFLESEHVDGVLVGGSSLRVGEFWLILSSFS